MSRQARPDSYLIARCNASCAQTLARRRGEVPCKHHFQRESGSPTTSAGPIERYGEKRDETWLERGEEAWAMSGRVVWEGRKAFILMFSLQPKRSTGNAARPACAEPG